MPTEFCHILGGFRGFPGGLNLEFSAKKSKKIFRKKNSKKIFPKKIPKNFFQKTNKNFTAEGFAPSYNVALVKIYIYVA